MAPIQFVQLMTLLFSLRQQLCSGSMLDGNDDDGSQTDVEQVHRCIYKFPRSAGVYEFDGSAIARGWYTPRCVAYFYARPTQLLRFTFQRVSLASGASGSCSEKIQFVDGWTMFPWNAAKQTFIPARTNQTSRSHPLASCTISETFVSSQNYAQVFYLLAANEKFTLKVELIASTSVCDNYVQSLDDAGEYRLAAMPEHSACKLYIAGAATVNVLRSTELAEDEDEVCGNDAPSILKVQSGDHGWSKRLPISNQCVLGNCDGTVTQAPCTHTTVELRQFCLHKYGREDAVVDVRPMADDDVEPMKYYCS